MLQKWEQLGKREREKLTGQCYVRKQWKRFILSRVTVTYTLFWIGESVYWLFTRRNYN
jgi:hypothetical protein